MEKHNYTSLELFSGAGGLSLGIHKAGFTHKALIEWNKHAINTLKENCENNLGIPSDWVIHKDARSFDPSIYKNRIDLLAGGPPCQPFSNSGKNLAHLDHRDMFPVFLNAIKKTTPKAILIENVKGLLRKRFEDYFHYIILRIMYPFAVDGEGDFRTELQYLKTLTDNSFPPSKRYKVTYQLIDTADFGVPQRRERVLITAFRADLGVSPKHLTKTHSRESLLRDQFVTGSYWKRVGIKQQNYLGPKDKKLLEKIIHCDDKNIKEALQLKPWVTVREAIKDLPKAVNRGEKEMFPNHVQHPGARIYTGHIGSFHDLPAKALKAGTHGTPGGENMLRINNSDTVRYFTTREAARLHTFPDIWTFNGETWGSCISQLGNAVPVQIGKIFAEYIKATLQEGRIK